MASATQDLEIFVRDALARGMPRASIASTLTNAGWSQAQVQRGLDAWADVDSAVPVPRPRASLSAREAFFYLLMFAMLYWAAWHLCSLAFDLINRALPDAADAQANWRSNAGTARFSSASLLIAFPVFLWMARLVARQVGRDPIARISPVRRWLTYLTLFLAALALFGDTITLANNLLGGEITVRFLLKVLVVALVGGAIFSYYLLDLRRGEDSSNAAHADRLGKALAIVGIVSVAGIVVATMVSTGTPMEQRRKRIDAARVQDLSNIVEMIGTYREANKTLPPDLRTLATQPGTSLRIVDPETGAPYAYTTLDATRYRLCATFVTDTKLAPAEDFPARDGKWNHAAGEQCFTRETKKKDEAGVKFGG